MFCIQSYTISSSRAQILILKLNQHFGTLRIDLFEKRWKPETKKYSNPIGVTSVLDLDKTYFIRSYTISSSRSQILMLEVNQHFGTLKIDLFDKNGKSETKKYSNPRGVSYSIQIKHISFDPIWLVLRAPKSWFWKSISILEHWKINCLSKDEFPKQKVQ